MFTQSQLHKIRFALQQYVNYRSAPEERDKEAEALLEQITKQVSNESILFQEVGWIEALDWARDDKGVRCTASLTFTATDSVLNVDVPPHIGERILKMMKRYDHADPELRVTVELLKIR